MRVMNDSFVHSSPQPLSHCLNPDYHGASMRIIYVDIDTLRADHLGCYGYHRATSPAIDALAKESLRFDRCYASDTPCLPSRTALTFGQFGINVGGINHGGVAAEPFIEGANRGFRATNIENSFAMCLRKAGFRTATISTFGERHSSLHWYAGYNEVLNVGKGGMESADEVEPIAADWLARNLKKDSWFLHLHLWDPHTPYRAPAAYGEPFAKDPLPAWYTEKLRAKHWRSYGPHGAQEVTGFGGPGEAAWCTKYPRQPQQIATMEDARKMFDGYDTGIRYADDCIGRLLAQVRAAGVWDDTAIWISGDHGETLGELGVYADHQTADDITHRLPCVLKWPGLQPRSYAGMHYQFDIAATIIELAGGTVGEGWDGKSVAPALRAGHEAARASLILSQAAWSCQRSARWGEWLLIRTYHDGYHPFPEVMLFHIAHDPHELIDLAASRPDKVQEGLAILGDWHSERMCKSAHGVDPMWTVLREGGPYHVRGALPDYIERLKSTGRADCAASLIGRDHGRPRELMAKNSDGI